MQREINELEKKVLNGIRLHEKILDFLLGLLIFVIIFGIGFTFGYYSHCK